MNNLTGRRIAWAICLYILLTAAGVLFFWLARDHFPTESQFNPLLALGGPALSLFTQMSYALFLLQSLLLVPWLLLGAALPKTRLISGVAFAIIWFVIGWRMHDLF